MSANTAVCLINLGICGAVGVACYATASAWPLLALIFLMASKRGGLSQ